jgi:microsomal prostaglandin-E synthase 2
MESVKLYEFSLCPFCNKVRAGLEIKGIPFESVEVSPRSKVELPPLPEGTPKKVPVLQCGDDTVADSTAILNYIEDKFPDGVQFHPQDPELRERSDEIEEWVDAQFIEALPTVIYGTWGEAVRAAKIVASSSKLSGGQKFLVQLAGAVVMKQISKRILKRNERDSAHAWVRDNTGQFASWLGDKPFVLGDAPYLPDVAMHGAITCVKEFPIFDEIMHTKNVAEWYRRMEGLRGEGRGTRGVG